MQLRVFPIRDVPALRARYANIDLTIRLMPGIFSPPTPQQTQIYMHGKQVIADGARAFVGSENITSTSLTRNRELGIIFSDPGMIQRLQQTLTTDFTTAGRSLPAQVCSSGSSCYKFTVHEDSGAPSAAEVNATGA